EKLRIALPGERSVKREIAVRAFRDHIVEIPEPPKFPAELDHMGALQPGSGVAERVNVDVLCGPARLHTHLLDAGHRNGTESHCDVRTMIHPFQTDFLYYLVTLYRRKAVDRIAIEKVVLDPAPAERIYQTGREDVRIAYDDRMMIPRSRPGPHLRE